jgi:3-hydroxyisobutyrate dehydrogenase
MENVRREDYAPAFPVRLMVKDAGLILRLARRLSVPLPALTAAQEVYATANAANPEEDMSAVVRVIEQMADVEPAANGNRDAAKPM